MAHLPTRLAGRGTATPVRSWQVRSSGETAEGGEVVSLPEYRARGFLDAPPRSTVMGALIAGGELAGVEFSTRMRDGVDRTRFEVPWWFRTTFVAPDPVPGTAWTTVRSEGIIHRADLFVNGHLVAGTETIAGAYTANAFDLSPLVRRGLNALAYLVWPGDPRRDLSIGWVDWNQWPPDNNMGIWRDVLLEQTGPLRLDRLRARPQLARDHSAARVSVRVDVENLTDEHVSCRLSVSLTPPAGRPTAFSRELVVPPGAVVRVELGPRDAPELVLDDPALWWPIGEGGHPLHHLEVTAGAGGVISDRAATLFGVRSVESYVEEGGGRRFVVNGRPLAICGAGYAPDIFLRHDRQRLGDELAYAAAAGLDTIRLEGKLENPELYEIADEMGLMVLPGWECCDKWEAHAGSGEPWDEQDFEVAARSMSSEAYRLANHPSVVGFFVGSDFPPEPRAAARYVAALEEAAFDAPVISAATVAGSEAAGPSGMKMTGPYDWVPPSYWYRTDEQLGGAVGFNSESGAGNNIPRLASLRRMMSEGELDALWREPEAKQFHAGPPSEFDNLGAFHAALAARYGPPEGLEDFVRKAHLASYETVRAQFEAYASRAFAPRPATGMVYWMLNSAWPSLNWQLWDWYLDPGAAYFAAREANQPLHAFFDYGDGQVKVVNRRLDAQDGLIVHARVRDVDGTVVSEETARLPGLSRREVAPALTVAPAQNLSTTYFLELVLVLDGAGSPVDRNVYWLSQVPDVLDLDATSWRFTPLASPADLRGLERLGPATVHVTERRTEDGATERREVELHVPHGGPPAVDVRASLVDRGSSLPVAPVQWDGNDIVVFAGQSVTLCCKCDAGAARDAVLEVTAFNLAAPG